jgi:ABC-type phosphate transport system substrate-binding protein
LFIFITLFKVLATDLKPIRSALRPNSKHIWVIVFLFILTERANSAPHSDPIDRTAIYPVVNINTSQRTISKNGLSAIFKMRLRHWNDGSDVTVFVLSDDNPLHKQFCKQILNVFPHQMRKNWNKLVFSGTGQAPIILENKEEMINKLRSTPGSVGYLSGVDLTKDLRILDIE